MNKLLLVVSFFIILGIGSYYSSSNLSNGSGTTIVEPEELDLLHRDPLVRTVEESRLTAKGRDMSAYDRYPNEIIGYSVEARPIRAYRYGSGDQKIVYVGAIHGGYEWNTALLSYEIIDYFRAYPETIPDDIQVIVIPVANPDGLFRAVGTWEKFKFADAPHFKLANEVVAGDIAYESRFNAHGIDLNRNFDCNFQASTATWRENSVNSGPSAFSEPETVALRDFFLAEVPVAVMLFHSASNGVYPASCNGAPLPGAMALLYAYSEVSGYPAYKEYSHYKITGDAEAWLAKQGIPAITVDLSTHDVVEWENNLPAVDRLLSFYSRL